MPSDRPVPDSVPRQKAYTYLFLVCLTSLLIYFYSYPLSVDNNWNYVKQKFTSDAGFYREGGAETHSALFRKLFSTAAATRGLVSSGKTSPSDVHTTTAEPATTGGQNDDGTSSGKATGKRHPGTPSRNSLLSTERSTRGRVTEGQTKSAAHPTTQTTAGEDTAPSTGGVPEGYLVFSEHCRIPDLDPMDPSIAHLIERNPPLDCSEGHQPLTRTEGHVLYLDETATAQRAGGRNYSCCYRSVYRENDGKSDNDVGFSDECTVISGENAVRDEFVEVECQYDNDTLFYQEFHSFVFDKPEVEERCAAAGDESRYSVLIVGVDAVSRLNMHRQLNATAAYLLDEMGATEMYGFNKVGDNTFPNLVPLLLGYDERELPLACWGSRDSPLDNCTFLWGRFAVRGYRTLYAEDSPHISSFNYAKRGFHRQPTDYYLRPFMLAYEDLLGRDKPLNCYRCVGSTSETEAVLSWTGRFAGHFGPDRPYFAFSWINSLTHDFLNTGSEADAMYLGFFRSLHRSGALDRTVVVLMGDHGMRWGSIRKTYVGRLEERLPMLLVALPPEFKRRHPRFARALEENARRLVTPFDLHATLRHLLDLTDDWTLENSDGVGEGLSRNYTGRAFSLFRPVPGDRSCDDAFIEEHWCTCESSLEVDPRDATVRRAADFVVARINDLLRPASDRCALLALDSVSDARLWQAPVEHEGHSADDSIYAVVIRAKPSGAVFEGTVRVSGPRSQLLGTVSRLNLYGNQSSCVDEAHLKMYCYCLR